MLPWNGVARDTPRVEETNEQPIEARVAATRAALEDEARALKALAAALGPLARPGAYAELGKLPGLLDGVEKRVAALPAVAERAAPALAAARAELDERRRRVRESLAPELRAACEARGLALRVVRQEEPLELRIPPLAVRVDRQRGSAEILFARQSLANCPADAASILAAREEALAELDGPFDAAAFFDACRTAWRAALGAGAGGSGERVEMRDFLPQLALRLQKPAFQTEPTARHFTGYPRSRFAWDVLRLRKAGGLSQNGWRMNLGVATGTTAQQKSRSIWLEDEHGDGEFKLTVFFTRAEGS